MTSGLILPGLGGGPDYGGRIKLVLMQHNAAIASLSPAQSAAVNRLLVATALVTAMVGDAPPDVQRGAAQSALNEVIRKEAKGEPVQPVMWNDSPQAETTDQMIDRLASLTRREVDDHG